MDLKQLFGLLDRDLLAKYFVARNVDLELDWSKLPTRRYGAKVFDAWCKLDNIDLDTAESELIDVARLGQERGVFGVISAGEQWGIDLKPEFEKYESAQSRILHTMLCQPELWKNIQDFVEVDVLATKRYWVSYPGIVAPSTAVDYAATADSLRAEVADFFTRTQGKGRTSDVRYVQRSENVHYYFIYLNSYSEKELAVTAPNRIEHRVRRPVVDVVFVYDSSRGDLSLLAKGGKDVTERLRERFCADVLKIDPPVIDRQNLPFQLDRLLDPDFQLSVLPAIGATGAKLRGLRLFVAGKGKRRMGLEGDPDGGANEVYDMAEQLLGKGKLSVHNFRVANAKIQMTFDPNGPARKRALTIDLSYPRTFNFKDEPIAVRQIIEKHLDHWGFNGDAADPAIHEAA